MAEPDVAADEAAEEALELRKEAFTMALYVAICLLAALSVVSGHGEGAHADTFKIVWGTTLGLALAHWFAFRVSSRMVASGSVRRQDAAAAEAQMRGGAAGGLMSALGILQF